jgi:hypothetical protein
VGGRVNFGTRLSKIWVYYNDSSYFTYRLTYRGGRGFGLRNRSVYILCKKNTCTYIYILICILYQYIREMIRAREHVQKRRPRRRKRNSVVARARPWTSQKEMLRRDPTISFSKNFFFCIFIHRHII